MIFAKFILIVVVVFLGIYIPLNAILEKEASSLQILAFAMAVSALITQW